MLRYNREQFQTGEVTGSIKVFVLSSENVHLSNRLVAHSDDEI